MQCLLKLFPRRCTHILPWASYLATSTYKEWVRNSYHVPRKEESKYQSPVLMPTTLSFLIHCPWPNTPTETLVRSEHRSQWVGKCWLLRDSVPVRPHIPASGIALPQASSSCLIASSLWNPCRKTELCKEALPWPHTLSTNLQREEVRRKTKERRREVCLKRPLEVKRSRIPAPDFTPPTIAQQAVRPVSSPVATKADARVQKDTWVVKNYKVLFCSWCPGMPWAC